MVAMNVDRKMYFDVKSDDFEGIAIFFIVRARNWNACINLTLDLQSSVVALWPMVLSVITYIVHFF